MFCSILCNNLNKKFKKSKKYFQKQVANIQSLNILSLTVQTLWGLCENSAFRFQMTWASHTDDALWRKRQNLCSLYWWQLRKLVPLFFSTLCLIYAWLMGVGGGWGEGCSDAVRQCVTPVGLEQTEPRAGRYNLTCAAAPTWLPVSVCVCVLPCATSSPCHRAKSHSLVCFSSADPCMWLTSCSGLLSSKRRNTTRLLSCGGCTPTHTSYRRNYSVVLCIEKTNVKLRLALWPGLCSKAPQVFSHKHDPSL